MDRVHDTRGEPLRPPGTRSQQRRIITSKMTGSRVAVLAADGIEESDLTELVKVLRDAGPG
ncbi:MAG: hypothetical protein JWO38_5109 [Gemmataceae bacterium]|nr:hypothetical protein [Gemmataceae bacterium]